MNSDLYATLGVAENASVAEIKRAYRAIARESHPDRNPDDATAEARFKAAAAAYRVLNDPEARRTYDARRAANRRSPAPRPSKKRWLRERGEDLRYTVRLTFEQAARGSTERLAIPDEVPCELCGGTGAAPGQPAGPCPDCDGEGRRPVPSGFFPSFEECKTCRGTGRVIRRTCTACAGLGTRSQSRQVVVDIPAGVEDGTRLRLTGEGRPGREGGPPGDLIVVVDIESHPLFERRGSDILVEVPISIGQAVLGAHIDIPTLDGQARLRVPPGTESGRVFRMSKQGLPDRSGARGDQKVRVVVVIPEALTQAQAELMDRWSELEAVDDAGPIAAYRARLRKLYES